MVVEIYSVFLCGQQLTGHHAGVAHQQDVACPPVGFVVRPELDQLLRGEWLAGLFFEIRQDYVVGEVDFHELVCHGQLKEDAEQIAHIPSGVISLSLGVYNVLKVSGGQQINAGILDGLKPWPGDAVLFLSAGGKFCICSCLVLFPERLKRRGLALWLGAEKLQIF